MEPKEENTETTYKIKSDEHYEFLVIEDHKLAKKIFKELVEAVLLSQGYQFYKEVQDNINKWRKQKSCLFCAIETSVTQDAKVCAICSIRENGSVWVHDIIPLCPVMEQPFRMWIINCMKELAESRDVTLIINKRFEEIALQEFKSEMTVDTANEVFDKAQKEMEANGNKSAVITME